MEPDRHFDCSVDHLSPSECIYQRQFILSSKIDTSFSVMTGREDSSIIRIKSKALSIGDTADSLTAKAWHIKDTWEVREGSLTYITN